MPRVLHLIHRDRDAAGILDILREPVKKRFFFKDGLPVFATSNVLNEVLGRLLLQEGVISQKVYESTLESVLKEKKKHGEVLISRGLITWDELDAFLTLQLKRRIWKIFEWGEGTYRYSGAERLPDGIPRLPLDPSKLILDGISLGFYPLERFKSDLRDYLESQIIVIQDTGVCRVEDFNLTIQEKRFFESFTSPDGSKKTLREILEGSDLLKQRALSLILTF